MAQIYLSLLWSGLRPGGGYCRGKVETVRSPEGHPVNHGRLCTIAGHLPEVFAAEERLTHPMIRRDGRLTPVDWEEAINYVAKGFRRVIEQHGPSAVAFYGGAANLLEEYYLMNKLMKAAIGSNNLECSTRLCMAKDRLSFVRAGLEHPPGPPLQMVIRWRRIAPQGGEAVHEDAPPLGGANGITDSDQTDEIVDESARELRVGGSQRNLGTVL